MEWVNPLKRKQNLLIGIDQGTSAIRYVVLHAEKKEILDWGSYDVGRVHDQRTKDHLSAVLKEIAKHYSPSLVASVGINLQGAVVFIGNLQIPVVKGDEQELIRQALKPLLPFPVEEAVYSAQEYKSDHKDPSDKRIINYMAVSKKNLNAIIDPVQDTLHLVPHATIQGYAFENLIKELRLAPADEMIGCINVGRGVTSISIFCGNKLLFQREIPLAGQDLTRAILILYRPVNAPEKMLNLEEAEKLKKASSVILSSSEGSPRLVPAGGDAGVYQAMQGVLAAWTQDIKLSFNYFYEHYQKGKLAKTYLLGGSANLNQLPEYLSQQLNMPVQLLQFPAGGAFSVSERKERESFKKNFHEYAAALAFALEPEKKNVLTLQEIKKAKSINLIEPVLRIFLISLAAMIMTWYLFLAVQAKHLEDIGDILTAHRRFLGRIEVPYVRMLQWQNFLGKADQATYFSSEIFKMVSRVTPPNMIFNNFQINREQKEIKIDGSVFGDPKNQAVTLAEFTKALKNEGFLRYVEVPSVESSVSGEEQGKFRLTAKLHEQVK